MLYQKQTGKLWVHSNTEGVTGNTESLPVPSVFPLATDFLPDTNPGPHILLLPLHFHSHAFTLWERMNGKKKTVQGTQLLDRFCDEDSIQQLSW